jgi:hypothetical protein
MENTIETGAVPSPTPAPRYTSRTARPSLAKSGYSELFRVMSLHKNQPSTRLVMSLSSGGRSPSSVISPFLKVSKGF